MLMRIALVIIMLAYPLLVYFLLPHFSPRLFGLMLIVVLGLRWLGGKTDRDWLLPLSAGALIALLTILFDSALLLKLYPSLLSLSFLLLFAWSLWHPPTIVERIARHQDPHFTDARIPYARAVTKVWCGFFIVNAMLSLLTVWRGDEYWWTLYNGLLSYLLMGSLFAVEYCVRRYLQRRERTA